MEILIVVTGMWSAVLTIGIVYVNKERMETSRRLEELKESLRLTCIEIYGESGVVVSMSVHQLVQQMMYTLEPTLKVDGRQQESPRESEGDLCRACNLLMPNVQTLADDVDAYQRKGKNVYLEFKTAGRKVASWEATKKSRAEIRVICCVCKRSSTVHLVVKETEL